MCAMKALDCHLDVRQALKDLRKRVESLKSDSMVYTVLLKAMEKDPDLDNGSPCANLDKSSPYTRFIQLSVVKLHSSIYANRANNLQHHRLGGKGAMVNLEKSLKAMQRLLQGRLL